MVDKGTSREAAPLPDGFGRVHRYLRISLTDRCNLRCRYCMPASGVPLRPREEILRFNEIARVTRVLVRLGVAKVRLTGGEPLVRRDVSKLVRQLAGIEGVRTLAMTTNGLLLEEHAANLRAAGLSAVNISLDTLRRDRFERLTRRDALAQVRTGLDAAMRAGFDRVKVNAVIMRGFNDDELADFARLARKHPLDVRFIEYMPFAGNAWRADQVVPFAEMIAALRECIPDLAPEPDDGVAEVFRAPGFAGTVGFISSMTRSFCASCDRLRLLADGSLKTCLFHEPEGSLRALLRSGCTDEELDAAIRTLLARKPEGHPPLDMLAEQPNKSMVQIGG